jgi:uncharacterized BrkB/YihY/UPF0761 family membrane protein
MSAPDRDDEPGELELPPPKRTLLRRFTAWVERAHALRRSVEAARSSSPALDATFETIERDSRLGGGMLAGALSYRLFVFALPLAFFIVSGLGVLAHALGVHADVVVNSVGFAGTVTRQMESAPEGASDWWVALTSLLVLVYVTRVLFRAIAIVHALAWEGSAAAVKARGRPLGIFAAAVFGQLLLVAGVGAAGHRSTIGGLAALVVFVAALAGLWLTVSLQLSHSDARWTELIPGSVLYAVGMVGVQVWNILVLGKLIESKSTTYGALGIAAALLLGFFLMGRVIVLAAVLNATLHDRRARSRRPEPVGADGHAGPDGRPGTSMNGNERTAGATTGRHSRLGR